MNEITLLNTRPKAQQKATHRAFSDRGFQVINFPCIKIQSSNNTTQIISALNAINSQDVIIFISQNAVHHAFKINPQWHISNKATIIAVGKQTTECLKRHTNVAILLPEQQNSQGIIAILQSLNKITSLRLITAENGRTAIQEHAKTQGLKLQQINVYERVLPPVSQSTVQALVHCNNLYVLTTSITTLNNLKILLSEQLWQKVLNSPLLCASSRIKNAAQQLGFTILHNLQTANPEMLAKRTENILKKYIHLNSKEDTVT